MYILNYPNALYLLNTVYNKGMYIVVIRFNGIVVGREKSVYQIE